MLTLIAGAALVAAIFIYNALRGIQTSLARIAGHFVPEQQNAQSGIGASAWEASPNVDPQRSPAAQQRAQAEANAAARFREAELERLATLERETARDPNPQARPGRTETASAEQATREEALRQETARRETARLDEARRSEYARGEAERAAAREAEARSAAEQQAAAQRYAVEYAAYQQAVAQQQAAYVESQRIAAERVASQRAAAGRSVPRSSAMWWTKPSATAGEPRPAAGAEADSAASGDPVAQAASTAADEPGDVRQSADRAPRRSAIDWEMFAGGRLFNIVGALTLIIGVGLLFKYAFDQNWIDEQWRVVLGIIVGGAVVAVGHVVRGRSTRTWFGDGIVGTGLGTLYLSGYGAFQSYHLVPFGVAYGYMSLVTLVAFALALRYDSIGISLIGWAGGFLTPFIVSDGGENELGLASYLVVLDLGMAAIGIVKSRWFAMQPLAMAATYLGVLYWYSQNAVHNSWSVSVVALLSLWFVFFASGVAGTIRRGTFSVLDAALAAVNGLVFVGYLEAAVGSHREAFDVAMSIVAVAYAIAYAVIAFRLPSVVALRIQYAVATGVAMLVATFSHDRGYDLSATLALEATAVLGIARLARARLWLGEARELLVTGFGLLGLAWTFGTILFTPGPRPWNPAWGGIDFSIVVLVLTTIAIERLFAIDKLMQGVANPGLRLLALFGACGLVYAHAGDAFGVATTLAAFALVLGWVGMRDRLVDLEVESIGLLAIAHLTFWSNPETYGFTHLAGYVPIANERFFSLSAVSGVTVALGEVARRRELFHPLLGRALRLAGAVALTIGGTFEIHDGFRIAVDGLSHVAQTQAIADATARLINSEPLAIMALWIGISIVMVGLGVAMRVREFRIYAIAVFDITILKAFYDLHDLPNPYKIFAFMGLGIVLLGVSALYSRLEQGFFGKPAGSGRDDASVHTEGAPAA